MRHYSEEQRWADHAQDIQEMDWNRYEEEDLDWDSPDPDDYGLPYDAYDWDRPFVGEIRADAARGLFFQVRGILSDDMVVTSSSSPYYGDAQSGIAVLARSMEYVKSCPVAGRTTNSDTPRNPQGSFLDERGHWTFMKSVHDKTPKEESSTRYLKVDEDEVY